MLSDTVRYRKEKKLHDVTRMWNLPEGRPTVTTGWRVGENGEMLVTGCRLSLSDEFKFCGSKGQHGDYSRQSCTVHLKLAKRVDLKCEHTRTKQLREVMGMLIN